MLSKPKEADFHNTIALSHTSETVCLTCKLFSSLIVGFFSHVCFSSFFPSLGMLVFTLSPDVLSVYQ